MNSQSNVDNLLFSFVKEIPAPNTKAGKVWRVYIRNGELNVNDRITITAVTIDGYSHSEVYNIEATIKSIHEEFDAIEGVMVTDTAQKDSIVAINLKSCYVNGKRINKKEISITKESIGISFEEKIDQYNSFYIRFTDANKAINVIKEGRVVLLLWFGKRVSANIIEISESLEWMRVQLLNNNTLAIPQNDSFRKLDTLEKIRMHIQSHGKVQYFSGVFDFDYSQPQKCNH
jgi:hypothetical protein